MHRAIFLDRDGTLNCDRGYTYKLTDFQLLDGVVEGLQLFQQLGFRLIVVTNQSGIARGYFAEMEMHTFNDQLETTLSRRGVTITGIYYSPYHPKATVEKYRRASPCRKPEPGMLLRAAKEHDIDLSRSYAVGDKGSDILAGRGAGCRTILLRTGCAGSDIEAVPDWVADNLLCAASIVRTVECFVRR